MASAVNKWTNLIEAKEGGVKMIAIFIFCSSVVFAHEGHHHGEHTSLAKTIGATPDLRKTYETINRDYQADIKPIFDKKCASCHSQGVPAPWYASIPVVRGIVESDRSEAKKHIEISKGFPFAGHGTVSEDLEALKDVIAKNSMPPFLYSLFHPSAKLTDGEKKTILKWITKSQKKFSTE